MRQPSIVVLNDGCCESLQADGPAVVTETLPGSEYVGRGCRLEFLERPVTPNEPLENGGYPARLGLRQHELAD
jgi:hypothetical protein